MPDTAGNTPAAPALDLKLSVPAEGDLRGIAGELATKIAEHLGAPDARSLGVKVAGLASRLGNGGGHKDQEIFFEFRQVDGELVVDVRCNGEATQLRQALS
jgi:cobalamin biosynthesis protein CbiG